MKNRIKLLALTLALLFGGFACNTDDDSPRSQESAVANQQLEQFLKGQPVPVFTYSQLRQNLIEIETAQANATATTSFFFNLGIASPITVCPSIGFPIPSTYQLTSPDKLVDTSRDSGVTLPQLEANGVYTADSTGTYVICVSDAGAAYAQYWEGFVAAVAGPATWNDETGQIELTGVPSAEFSTDEG